MYSGVSVTLLNGTSMYTASNKKTVTSLYDTFTYDATGGNVVYVYVKSMQVSPYFNLTAQLIATRITPWPTSTSNSNTNINTTTSSTTVIKSKTS